VSISTTEPEYIVLSKAAPYFLLLKTVLKDLRFPETLMDLLYDNHSAIDLAKYGCISELSKYIDIHHHPARELVYDKSHPLMYIRTTDNLLDMCTKALVEVQFTKSHTIDLGYNDGGFEIGTDFRRIGRY
jgi:hypothetical protein